MPIPTLSPSRLAVVTTNEDVTTETNKRYAIPTTRTSVSDDFLAYTLHMLPKSHTASITISSLRTCLAAQDQRQRQ